MYVEKSLSESDELLLSWGYDLWDEYLEMIEFAKIPHNSLILDFGTGSGRALSILLQLNYCVVSVDYDLNQIKRANERVKNLKNNNKIFLINDFYQTNFYEKSIKYIVCGNVLHETQKPEILIDIMLKSLDYGGKLLIWDFNKKGFEIMANLHKIIYNDIHNEGMLKIEDVKKIISQDYYNILEYDTKLNKLLVIERK